MKVCMIGHFPPHLGGIASYVYLLSKSLQENGDKVYVVTYPHENIQDLENIRVESAPAPNIKGLRGLFFAINGARKVIQLVKEEDIDIIHAHYLFPPGLAGLMASMFTGRKFYVTLHGSDVFLLSSNKFLKPILKLILQDATGVFAVSESVKKEVLKLGIPGLEDKLKVTWNGIDTEKFHPKKTSTLREELNIASDESMILFVGNLVKQKGLKYLLRAKKIMKEDSKLVIVGGGPLLNDLKGMVEYEKIENVIFTGPRYDVDEILPAADIVTLPSISESFGIALLEAMASGKPVVGTKVGGIPELINNDAGILVEAGDSIGLSEALDKLLANADLREKMGEEGRKIALKFAKMEIPY
ncbi:glycosyltransferase family 4 protein [Methanobacterium alcaliphilum]|uniref:glycosyltransferase family 4 protein n=1 Tax=Methanobacterium alcaliphilum TaxID=392018 RepID=UPI00200B894E|nr:glycosyltransferase family 4 protein [Methanobacterium alcaliphilum]MCK9150867.1 glycosyltransferase family 4 protein [Methanobacterium alcaliphilum]